MGSDTSRTRSGHHRIPHVGGCILEDEVEVGSNSCIDRGSIDDTGIGRGTKLDNLVHVGHNVRIGERCLIMAGVGIAGSTRIGNDVILAGHVGVTDHLVIGDRARIAAKSAVFGDVPAGASFSGHPARGRTASSSERRPRCTGWRPSSTSSSGWCRSEFAMARRTLAGAHGERHRPPYRHLVSRPSAAARRRGRASCSAGPTSRRPEIPARLGEVQSTERRTVLGQGETVVQTVEHLLAAAAALQLDDLTIELDGPEPPIGDGSFAPYLTALERGRDRRSSRATRWCIGSRRPSQRHRGRLVLRRCARQVAPADHHHRVEPPAHRPADWIVRHHAG